MNKSRVRWLRVAGVLLLGAVLFAGCVTGERGDVPRDGAPRLLDALGSHSFPVSTESELAQRYFDQGLALVYGFNHHAAVAAFDEAAYLDPACAACYWGKAYALGPNINAPMGPEAAREAYAAVRAALERSEGVSAKERELIDALAERYAPEPQEDRSPLDRAYADAMRRVQSEFPEDTDIATLTAEAMMDTMPWDYWGPDAEPRENTEEVLSLLEWVLEKEPNHLGANHYYIHATEEYFPEKAEPAADRLKDLAPDAGHLVHMPSHIYWRVGRYDDAAEVNKEAAAADEQYFAWCRPGGFYRALYYPHNVHFLWAAAAAQGQSELALTAARKLAQQVEELYDEFPLVEEFLTVPQLTLVRFGRWDDALGEPKPPEGRSFQTAIWHYARGVARTRTGDLEGAEAELAELRAFADSQELEEMIVSGGVANAASLLEIGIAHLQGELAAARGNATASVAALEDAVSRQDALAYMEPPPWYFPTRQALGAALLEQGLAAEAEAVYLEDLKEFPKNGWSLFGLAKSLRAQGKDTEADWAEQGHRNAFARADVTLERSSY